MDRIKVKTLIEQMSGLIEGYLSTDLDYFTMDQITDDIFYIERVIDQWAMDDDVTAAVGLLSDCVSSMYVARGLATIDIPRDRMYYQSMQEVKRLFRQIRGMR